MPEVSSDQAVALVTAVVARTAEVAQIPVLMIKGPTFVALGVREPEPSSDVDVLCHPAYADRLVAALAQGGWTLQETGDDLRGVQAAHAVALRSDTWPCSVDVHHYFPGFLAPPEQVFDALARTAVTVEVAGQPVPSPDPVGSALIWGLNVMRAPHLFGESRLQGWTSAVRRLAIAPEALADLAAETGSSATLRPLLQRVDAPERTTGHGSRRELQRWFLLQQPDTSGTGVLTRWADLPARSWPRAARQALWPDLPAETRGPHTRTNARRLAYGTVSMPRLLRKYWTAHQQARAAAPRR